MKGIILAAALMSAISALAQTKHVPEEVKAETGYEKAENDLFPKTASYDGKWTVDGFSIFDAQCTPRMGESAWRSKERAWISVAAIPS